MNLALQCSVDGSLITVWFTNIQALSFQPSNEKNNIQHHVACYTILQTSSSQKH
uniref:Uncharacterized protein n=1 Tax=Anguilla anguilla TaxID=7936 RepID=A0A0E9WCJ3_ANGAN